MDNKDRVDGRYSDKGKKLPTFSMVQKIISADYLVIRAKNIFNLL